jgi:hypothetical protein
MADGHMTDFDRFGRITASVVSAILRSEGETRSGKWAWRVITGREPITPPGPDCERGLEHEDDAIAAAEVQLCTLAKPGRFVVHPELPWLGASPDGFITELVPYPPDRYQDRQYFECDIPIEAKCPRQLHSTVPPKYYDQVQTQIECCNVPYAYFVSWTENGGQWVTKIERDVGWWLRSKPILEDFYDKYVVPDIEPPRAERRKKEK